MGTLKDVVDLTTQLANSVSDRKIGDELNKIQRLTLSLQSEQNDLHETNIHLREKNLELREAITQLKSQQDVSDSLTYDGDVYWKESKEGRDGPFCPRCYDTKKLLVRIQEDGRGWWCKECSDHYGPSDPHAMLV